MAGSDIQDLTIRADGGISSRWWATRDSNPDGLLHTPLKRARLPVPPAAQLSRLILPFDRVGRHRRECRRTGLSRALDSRIFRHSRLIPPLRKVPAEGFEPPTLWSE